MAARGAAQHQQHHQHQHQHRLQELEREQAILKPLQSAVPHAWSILAAEIHRLRSTQLDSSPPPGAHQPQQQLHTSPTSSQRQSQQQQHQQQQHQQHQQHQQPQHQQQQQQQQPQQRQPQTPVVTTAVGSGRGVRTRKRVKIPIPIDKAPLGYNYVGRILGPRGATLKTLERETGCKIMIRGRGSIRKDKEMDVRGKPGWEHVFAEALHVVCEVTDAMDEQAQLRALARAKEAIELLLVPVPDEKDSLKRQQLRELAILNGTYRARDSSHSPASLNGSRSGLTSSHSFPSPTGTHTISPAHLAQSMSKANRQLHAPQPHPPHLPHQTSMHSPPHSALSRGASPPLSASPVNTPDLTNNFNKLSVSPSPTQQMPSPRPAATSRAPPTFTSAQPHQSNITLPAFPSLDLDGVTDQALNLPASLASSLNPVQVPLSSPTIVDPELYPFPPTPNVIVSPENQAFGSPIWSPLPRSNSASGASTAPVPTTGPKISTPPSANATNATAGFGLGGRNRAGAGKRTDSGRVNVDRGDTPPLRATRSSPPRTFGNHAFANFFPNVTGLASAQTSKSGFEQAGAQSGASN